MESGESRGYLAYMTPENCNIISVVKVGEGYRSNFYANDV